MTICIVDTSVLLNVLAFPGFASSRKAVVADLKAMIENGETDLLLPFAAVLETGNHVARLTDGGERRRAAELFVQEVRKAFAGEAPWTVTPLPDRTKVDLWLADFPDLATRGLSLADATIIDEWERQRRRWAGRRVRIWSLDKHLSGYDTGH